MAALELYFKKKGVTFTAAASRMGYAPKGAAMFYNESGIAQAYNLENVFVLPGVPSIMRLMLDLIVGQLKTGETILTGTIQTNARESEIAKPLQLIQERHPFVDIGSYPVDQSNGESQYKVIFLVKGTDQIEINDVCQQVELACHDLGFEAHLV